jgi:hypothetical protein
MSQGKCTNSRLRGLKFYFRLQTFISFSGFCFRGCIRLALLCQEVTCTTVCKKMKTIHFSYFLHIVRHNLRTCCIKIQRSFYKWQVSEWENSVSCYKPEADSVRNRFNEDRQTEGILLACPNQVTSFISEGYFVLLTTGWWGHAVAYWLRNDVTSRKIAGLRPDEVNEFFQFT